MHLETPVQLYRSQQVNIWGPCPHGSCPQATGYLWGIQKRRFGPFASPFRPHAEQSLANSEPWRQAARILLHSTICPKFSCHPHAPRLVLSLFLWPLCSSQLMKISKNLFILNPSLLKKQAGDLVGSMERLCREGSSEKTDPK